MRVLQVVKTNEGAKWAYTQALWLFRNGVDIITVLPSLNGGIAEMYKKEGMKIIEADFSLPINKPWLILDRIKKINMLIEEINPDLIHCHFVTNILMLRLALMNKDIPRLFQVPGPLHLESSFFRRLDLILSNKSDYWAGACKKTCKIYTEAGIESERIFLAYYGGYGGKSINEYKSNIYRLHKEFNIPKDTILVGMVSYFYKPKAYLLQQRGIKGHEDFIDAIAIARKKNPKIIGIIIGDSWANSHRYVNKVKKYAEKKCKNGVIFTGFRTDLKDVYKELNIVVHPSLSENLGGAAESLAAGVPTITTNVGGFPDIVISGETGYTVNPKSPNEISHAIDKMLGNMELTNEMVMNGKEKVSELLSIENTGKNILSIYKKIITRYTHKCGEDSL